MWKQIQEIRRLHDKAYKRWMPHLNLLYPFVPEKEFSKASAVFSEILADFRPFHVEFHKFDFFSHGKSCTIFLKPSFVSEDDDELFPLKNLQEKLQDGFPFCDDLSNISENGYQPHLTVGQFADSETSRLQCHKFHQQFIPITFIVDKIHLISRTVDGPFQIQKTICFPSTLGSRESEMKPLVEQSQSQIMDVEEDKIGGSENITGLDLEKDESVNPLLDLTLRDRIPSIAAKVDIWVRNQSYLPRTRGKLLSAIKPFCRIKVQVLDVDYVIQKLASEGLICSIEDRIIFTNQSYKPTTTPVTNMNSTKCVEEVREEALQRCFSWVLSSERGEVKLQAIRNCLLPLCLKRFDVDPNLVIDDLVALGSLKFDKESGKLVTP
eukprot:TRINITY_DN453_c0_g2_i1.p1 TRINITY_DN453_c0_g2~~TRINITY_DN453_c0_g2_i1.p1  ORF type:complete len:380 (-),score=80.44 TRINITY_DN453_c0_g2_i1:108-1247(-)